ncbi:MAG: hypothetical protein RR420_01485 [Anaerovoracaceae bacterium]
MSKKKNKKVRIEVLPCPLCEDKTSVGLLQGSSNKKYFCSECCVMFEPGKDGKMSVSEIDENGNIIPMSELLQKLLNEHKDQRTKNIR